MFFQISPPKATKRPTAVKKEKESEKVETLSLAPFTANPKLFFDDVKVAEVVTQQLLINNPTNRDVSILVIHSIPEELNVTLSWTEATILKDSNVPLNVTWCPLMEGSSRYVITITDGKKIQRDVPIAFKSILPKKSKTGTIPKVKTVVRNKKSPIKKTSSVKKTSPTKKYYSTRPPNTSPKKYSLSGKKFSPTLKKKILSPTKITSIVVTPSSPSAKIRQHKLPLYTDSPKTRTTYRSRTRSTKETVKENIPSSLLNKSTDSNVFVSPSSATFRLDYLQSAERRETYTVNGKEQSPTDSIFSDSLENIPPEDVSPPVASNKERQNVNIDHLMKLFDNNKLPLGESNRENISQNIYEFMQQKPFQTPADYGFEYKLTQLESFRFTPVSTPIKHIDRSFSLRKTPEAASVMQPVPEKNTTFEIPQKSPNVSTETYIKSNLSTGTYVKDNASFETYVKGNMSSGTYTKDSSIGDVASLSLSPVSISPGTSNTSKLSITQSYNLSGDNVKSTITANLWCGTQSRALGSIQEESCIQQSTPEVDITQKSFLKRKSVFDIEPSPPKRQNVASAPKDWSKKGGAALRVARKTTGLNLQHLTNNNTAEGDKEPTAILTKKDTNTVIIQNPFILAATNLADPFMTAHLCINEEWIDQQQRDFKKWLNALLTPPEQLNFEEQVVDVTKVWQECKIREVEVAPTKEAVSNKYHTNSRLNSLRKSAQNLFKSKEMSEVLSKVVLAVETGKLTIRSDKDIHLNLMLRSEIMSMVLSYNPLWLRIGLETIYNETIPLKSNSDVMGLSTFIGTRLLRDPYLFKKHKTVHSPIYSAEFKKFFLKKFFVLVYFLDQAKNKKLILHDPCLFCKKATVKESKEMLVRLAKETLAAVGDVTKYLRHLNYVVTHTQTYIHEFDYAVNNLGCDLRDGVRLTKIMEIILLQNNLLSNLRVPAISRLQKIHNVKIVFDSLEKAGFQILYDITPKDIVDGHKEKTLSFLWQIIYKFQTPLMVKSATTIQTWFRSLPVVLKRRQLKRELLKRECAAIKIQAWYRRQKFAKKLCEFSSLLRVYLETRKRERAVIKIQSYYRMHRCRSLYIWQYMTIINIQRYAKGWLVRNVYKLHNKSTVLIQRNIRMYLARKKYLMLKEATNVIQTKFRANQLMKRERTAYMELRTAVIFVQRKFRANRLATQDRNAYQELRSAAIFIQQRFRANRLCRQERTRYLEMRSAAIRIQTWYRSIITMRTCRQQYLSLKKSVIIVEQRYIAMKARREFLELRIAAITIQRRFRANALMKEARKSYQQLLRSTIIIQQRFRANKAMLVERDSYQRLRNVAIFIQQKWRAKKLCEIQQQEFNSLKNAALIIQRRWRANKLARQERTVYQNLRKAAQLIQTKWRAKKLGEKERCKYQQMKRSAIIIQRWWRARKARQNYLQLRDTAIVLQQRWRAKKLCELHQQRYEILIQTTIFIQRRWRLKKLGERDRNDYIKLKMAAICIQRRWRARQLMIETSQRYALLKSTTIMIQQRFRANLLMKQQRQHYIKIKTSAIVIQRYFRRYLLMKKERDEFQVKRNTIAALQKYIRGYLIRRKYADYLTPEGREKRKIEETERKAATRIQAHWRGYRSRSSSDSFELTVIRERVKKANLQAERDNTLGSRCKVALQTLINEKSTIFIINKSLEDLDFITRHSKDTCTELAQFLPEQMYLMIKTTNRSLPEMNVCLSSVNILININKYAPTRPFSFMPDHIDNIITVMLHWCDKDAQLFPSICTLLWLFAHNPRWKRFIKSLPNIDQRLSKMQAQVLRKDSMVKRVGIKGHSVFGPSKNLPLPSCKPDWGLQHKRHPYVFTNSVYAFLSLLEMLNM